jgi:hypothetical protein
MRFQAIVIAVALDAPQEIKELAQTSAAVSERARHAVPTAKASEEALSAFRDIILDSRADLLAFYKVAVLEARRADTPEEVAAIWKEVLFFCRAMQDGWRHLRGFEPTTQSLIEHYRELLTKLENTALEHYQLHIAE